MNRFLKSAAVLAMVFSGACREHSAHSAEPKSAPVQTRTQLAQTHDSSDKRPHRELRYLYFANGGIIGYFDDGSISGCPRCDFSRSNIIAMFERQPHARYTINPDGSLLVDGTGRVEPRYDSTAPDGWALIDYKWHIRPPQH